MIITLEGCYIASYMIFSISNRVFDKIFSLHQIGSVQDIAEPIYYY